MDKWWKTYLVDIPEGQSGDWKIEKFSVTIDEAKLYNARASFNFSNRGQYIRPGDYTKLMRKGTVVMSDTPSEIRDHLDIIGRAEGQVLIGGLGLGVVVGACCEKPEVEHVTVIEISPNVIELVGQHYQKKFGDKLTIIQDDVFTWKWPRGAHYSVAWFDIWDNVCGDNASEMTKLKRRYARKADHKSCWREWECRRADRDWRRQQREMDYWRQ